MIDYARQTNVVSIDDKALTAYQQFLIPFPVLLVRFDDNIFRLSEKMINCDYGAVNPCVQQSDARICQRLLRFELHENPIVES